MQPTEGRLFLIPTRLGDNPPLEVLPLSIKKIIENTQHFIVENEKSARRFIKRISPKKSQQSLVIYVLNKFTDPAESHSFLDPCLQGHAVGLLSEAGCPAIADPGSEIVRMAHDRDIRVIPLVGPSAILLAMMSSGMNGQNFAFNGYLPIDKKERKQELKRLERLSSDKNQSQIFIETPYRNNQILSDILQTLNHNTRLCIASDISLPSEFIRVKTIEAWHKSPVDLHKRPTIFIIHQD
ncbi:MAG: SAM-dependent methyltransferase [Flavobacteriaceae bacterium]|nr:SAM-dependent methyltransferase [Bacteroidia bacterium]MBT8288259.1 SAM-dependent methyltransferase [Bacteroidia bacterium]NNF74802.1 SAM-dependent methyltransferase [Flavobacteriaceae bacterium]NNK73931.1 SAM-dependent methyltransferase [Flavobacteriaceae bacterium]